MENEKKSSVNAFSTMIVNNLKKNFIETLKQLNSNSLVKIDPIIMDMIVENIESDPDRKIATSAFQKVNSEFFSPIEESYKRLMTQGENQITNDTEEIKKSINMVFEGFYNDTKEIDTIFEKYRLLFEEGDIPEDELKQQFDIEIDEVHKKQKAAAEMRLQEYKGKINQSIDGFRAHMKKVDQLSDFISEDDELNKKFNSLIKDFIDNNINQLMEKWMKKYTDLYQQYLNFDNN